MAKKMVVRGKKVAEESKVEGEIRFPRGVPAEVKEVVTRAGSRGLGARGRGSAAGGS